MDVLLSRHVGYISGSWQLTQSSASLPSLDVRGGTESSILPSWSSHDHTLTLEFPQGFRSSVLGTGDKDQLFIYLFHLFLLVGY